MKEERRQAKEDQSEEIEISESDSSGCAMKRWRRGGVMGDEKGRRRRGWIERP